ncbi:DNA REPLICATION LICENSING FACTOR MCM1 domain containing protein [Babesia bigemina]|uniref:DNA REPLICATION LICENSING FACTOR MCM1 domain containing protein n=1 Tax=Babesia bigemina TaxID=5866 RepID=A0A061D7L9_BABBI|nr:DNA REPLICATION LICENSING FACTOR MCM1 domain containing protein [Babesia bigemina]CDR94889.1 DNA REPLICATION LICENSING FACTOR MCM1 domain containing protein [Babesia bigemina]|eukprot:XP_012767075.1 DNA REPLICATION LICENSING FACTOR MCM1 domain containing protein [Babesia bigemina]
MSKITAPRESFPKQNTYRRDASGRQQSAVDAVVEQLYFPGLFLPPLGYREDTASKKGGRICDIVASPVSYYVNGFIQYIVSDDDLLSQYLDMLCVNKYEDPSLLKKLAPCTDYAVTTHHYDLQSSASFYNDGKDIKSSQFLSSGSPSRCDPNATTPRTSYLCGNPPGGTVNGSTPEVAAYRDSECAGNFATNDIIKTEPVYEATTDGRADQNSETCTPKRIPPPAGYSQGTNSRASVGGSADNSRYTISKHYRSVFIDVMKLIVDAPALGSDLMTAPDVLLRLLDLRILPLLYELLEKLIEEGCHPDPVAIVETFHEKYDIESLCKDSQSVSKYLDRTLNDLHCKNTLELPETKRISKNLQFTTRLRNIPPIASVWKNRVDHIREEDVGGLVTLVCTVTRVGIISVLDEEREYRCVRCHQSVLARAVPELHYFIVAPSKCPHYLETTKGAFRPRCFGDTFVQGVAVKRADLQEIRCQSISEDSRINSIGVAIPVVLRRDITGTCVPGDTIHLIGMVKRRWRTLRSGRKCVSQIFVDALNLDVINLHKPPPLNPITTIEDSIYSPFWAKYRKDEVAGRNILLKSICTTMAGVDNAKLGLLLTVIGGFPVHTTPFEEETHVNRWAKFSGDRSFGDTSPQRTSPGLSPTYDSKATRLNRTQCHILFLGHPGTGKSQFLRFAKSLVDRHVSVSGTHCTSAGLTCTVVRDCGHTMLAAGALVLADGGLCCVDEFSLIHPDDKACLHEAMEQQVISVAKVGIKCSLNCRCSVIAASNFKMQMIRRYVNRDDSQGGTHSSHPLLSVDVPIPLLSRFDLVMVFTENPLNDSELVDFLLDTCEAPIRDAKSRALRSLKGTASVPGDSSTCGDYDCEMVDDFDEEDISEEETDEADMATDGTQPRAGSQRNLRKDVKLEETDGERPFNWNANGAMKEYIEYIRAHLFPTLTVAARRVIHAYYVVSRQQALDSGSHGGPTIRTVESLLRLSQAHARLMFRDHVSIFDAVSAIWIGEFGLHGYKVGAYSGQEQLVEREGLFEDIGALLDLFGRQQGSSGSPNDFKMGNGIVSMEMYNFFEKILLERLGLTNVANEAEVKSEANYDSDYDTAW